MTRACSNSRSDQKSSQAQVSSALAMPLLSACSLASARLSSSNARVLAYSPRSRATDAREISTDVIPQGSSNPLKRVRASTSLERAISRLPLSQAIVPRP